MLLCKSQTRDEFDQYYYVDGQEADIFIQRYTNYCKLANYPPIGNKSQLNSENGSESDGRRFNPKPGEFL